MTLFTGAPFFNHTTGRWVCYFTLGCATGKDGRVLKRARQNTSLGSVKARLIAGLGDEIRSR